MTPTGTPVIEDPGYEVLVGMGAQLPSVTGAARVNTNITGLTGGGVTKLDGIPTVALAVKSLTMIVTGNEFQVWQLQAGTTVESAAGGVVRPDDYAGSTNEKIWIKVL